MFSSQKPWLCPIVDYRINKVLDTNGVSVPFTGLLSIDSLGTLTIEDFT